MTEGRVSDASGPPANLGSLNDSQTDARRLLGTSCLKI